MKRQTRRKRVTNSTIVPSVLCQLNMDDRCGVLSSALVITQARGRMASMQAAVIQCSAWFRLE